MASGDSRDIKSFLKEKELPEGSIKAVEDYGLKTYADFVCMTEKDFDDLQAKGFEKERLKKVWIELKGQAAPAGPQATGQTVMHGGQGNIGSVHNPGRIGQVGHTYNQGPVGPGARQQNNSDNATGNVQADRIGNVTM